MRLLVGLGNPGESYARNRHNIGYLAADHIVRRHSFSGWRSRFQGRLAEGTVAGEKVLVLKPETFMNLSGQAVAAVARFLKILPADIVVVHDELDLRPGKVRVKRGGGAGGHNGLKSIDAHIGSEYLRVRLGIGHPGDKDLVTPWVLSDFAKTDETWLAPLLDAVAVQLPVLLAGDENAFMTRLAQAVPAPNLLQPD
jgi:PTH1 family peptidyl-tRNA hydrolase